MTTTEVPKTDQKAKPEAAVAISGSDLIKDLEAGLKTAISGKLDRVQKQNYVRLMSGKTLVCYLRPSKKHALIQLELPVHDKAAVKEAVTIVSKVLAARAK